MEHDLYDKIIGIEVTVNILEQLCIEHKQGELEMAVCKNCGATIEDKEVKCPFCSALQYDAAEEQYMDNLYKVNETMDHLEIGRAHV